ncbi:hypothetical protein ACFL6X_07100 [Candidatus Latescibacterota bacterium]
MGDRAPAGRHHRRLGPGTGGYRGQRLGRRLIDPQEGIQSGPLCFAAGRLRSLDPDHLTFTLKNAWSNGTTHL